MEEEQKNLRYQETMKVDVENISKYKINWRPIYEVIDTSFLQKQENPPKVIERCKKYPNEPQFLPSEVKVVLKQMAMEQGLYA